MASNEDFCCVGVEGGSVATTLSTLSVPVEATSKCICVVAVPEGIGPKVIVTSVHVFVGGKARPVNISIVFHEEPKQNMWGQTVMVDL